MDPDLSNLESNSLRLPMLTPFDNSISMNIIEVSRSYAYGYNEQSLAFPHQMTQETYVTNSYLLDEDSIRFPLAFFKGKNESQERKLMVGFTRFDFNHQTQNKSLIKGEDNIDEQGYEEQMQFVREQYEEKLRSGNKNKNKISTPATNTTISTSTAGNSSRACQSLQFFNSKKQPYIGLKQLSQRVRDILSTKKLTSYKDIADSVISNEISTRAFDNQSPQEVAKNNLNIKRRIYDSLNVLVAVGVLKKENKKLVMSNECKSTKPSQSQIEMRQQLLNQIQLCRNKVKDKKRMLESVKMKYQTLGKLRERNQTNVINQQQRFYTPTMFVTTPQAFKLCQLINFNQNNLSLILHPQTQLKSQLDLLSQYSAHIFSQK